MLILWVVNIQQKYYFLLTFQFQLIVGVGIFWTALDHLPKQPENEPIIYEVVKVQTSKSDLHQHVTTVRISCKYQRFQ